MGSVTLDALTPFSCAVTATHALDDSVEIRLSVGGALGVAPTIIKVEPTRTNRTVVRTGTHLTSPLAQLTYTIIIVYGVGGPWT